MPAVYPTDMLTDGILTWFGMFGAENASSDALQAFVIWACAVAVSSFWLCFRRYAAMFDACLFIFVWQVVSWHDLACLVQRMLLATHCNAFVIWACAVAVSSFWLCFRRYAAMFDACLFIFVWQVVSWHDFACLVQRMPLLVHCKHLWFEHVLLLSVAFDFASGGMLPCLMPVYWYMFDRWYPDMIWHVSSSTCLCFAFANTCARCYTEGRAGHNKSTQNSRKQVWRACTCCNVELFKLRK